MICITNLFPDASFFLYALCFLIFQGLVARICVKGGDLLLIQMHHKEHTTERQEDFLIFFAKSRHTGPKRTTHKPFPKKKNKTVTNKKLSPSETEHNT